jgi:hypothetical protein
MGFSCEKAEGAAEEGAAADALPPASRGKAAARRGFTRDEEVVEPAAAPLPPAPPLPPFPGGCAARARPFRKKKKYTSRQRRRKSTPPVTLARIMMVVEGEMPAAALLPPASGGGGAT